jgi:mannosyltransferase OCH1-like enzyme
VILTTSGGFPDYVPDILNMMNDDEYGRGAYGRDDDWIGSIQEAHVSWKVRNPQYEIRYYDLHYCRLYLRQFYHPLFLRAFDCIEAFAGKVNLFRYLVVYREGGYYSDWKQLCLKDGLLDYLSNSVDVDQPRWDRPASGHTVWYSAWGNPGRMQNAFFGAMPRSPILAEAIRLSLRNIQGRADLVPGAEALKMTGVGVLHRAVMKVARGLDGVRFGTYHYGDDKVFRHRNETIIKHKCSKCGQDQSWEDGNDYTLKLKIGEYFCPDAPSLFSPGDNNGTKTPVLRGRCFW